MILAAVLLTVAAVATFGALGAYGRPVAGALVDASGQISNVGPGYWDAKRQGFGFPDRVVAVDGVRLDPRPGFVAEQFDAQVVRAVAAGRSQIRVVVRAPDGRERPAAFTIHRLEGAAWWLFAAMSLVTGLLWSGTGLIALWASPTSALARTTAHVGVAIGLFMLTLCDMHTSRVLVPLFWLAYALVPAGFIMLALRLPRPAQVLSKLPWFEWVLGGASAALGAALVSSHALGRSTETLQIVAGSSLGVGILFFAACFVLRLALARDRERATMRTLAWAMVPPHAVTGFFVIVSSWRSDWSYGDLLMYPTLGLAPVATIYAVVRFDIWGSRAVLSRVLIRVALAAAVWMAATALGATVASIFGLDVRNAALAAGVAAMAAIGALAVLLDLSDRLFFSAHAAYKPTVAQLSSELTAITSPGEVAVAIERTVRRWLHCERVKLTLFDPQSQDSSGEWPIDPERLAGQPTADGGRRLDVAFAGIVLAQLEVGPKPGSALYATTDLDLLATIADQGGLALAHAFAYEELEHRRREQAQAWRGERAALVETVAGEIAHEIRHPINFFRSVFDGASSGAPLDEEEIEVGREEIERLERLVAGLRRLTSGRIEREVVDLLAVCERAERVLRDAMGSRRLSLDVTGDVSLRCDHDKVVQVLVNLLSNALEASAPSGAVGITWKALPSGGELAVWDEGPGFEGDPARLFAPWHTTKPHGTGLGLAITYRLVRSHDWTVRAERAGDRTRFVVKVRGEDIVSSHRRKRRSRERTESGVARSVGEVA